MCWYYSCGVLRRFYVFILLHRFYCILFALPLIYRFTSEGQESAGVDHEKKGLLEVMVRAVTSLYDGAKTGVKVRSAYLEEFEEKVGVHQGSVLSPLLLAIVVNVITE